jgi:hypothetical protein
MQWLRRHDPCLPISAGEATVATMSVSAVSGQLGNGSWPGNCEDCRCKFSLMACQKVKSFEQIQGQRRSASKPLLFDGSHYFTFLIGYSVDNLEKGKLSSSRETIRAQNEKSPVEKVR